MINIELTPQQASELKKYYEAELEKIRAHENEIIELIKKLDINSTSKENKEDEKDNEKEVVKLKEQKEIINKQNAEKPEPPINKKPADDEKKDKNAFELNWYSFVIQILQEKNKPLGSDDMLKLYEEHSGNKIKDMKYARNKLGQVLYRLRHTKKRIRTIKQKGKKETFYALTEWPVTDIKINKEPLVIKEIGIVKTPPQVIERKIISKTTSGKRGQYNWPKFIVDTLNKTKRVLTAREFLKHAMIYYAVPKHEQERTRGKLAPALSRLEKVTKTLKTVSKKGQRSRYFGLSEWFDEKGTLIPIYK